MACSKIYTDPTKDDCISTVLKTFLNRPIFFNLFYSVNKQDTVGITLPNQYMGYFETEMVGSSQDGLKVGRVFDVGDVDALIFSNTLTFDNSDESHFEYRKNNPCFCFIPQPKTTLTSLKPVEGKYLNANYLRSRHPDLFKSSVKDQYSRVPFTIMPSTTSQGETKCAITGSVHYSDPVPDTKPKDSLQSTDHRLIMAWETEHLMLTHLMLLKNRDKITFVKGLLFQSNIATDSDTKSYLKQRFAMWKQDFQKETLLTFDLLFFRSSEFIDMISKAIDPDVLLGLTEAKKTKPHGDYSIDLVPAIKCSGWPRPANTFRYRERKWPPEHIVESIIQNGYQVVAKPPERDPLPEIDFLLSFSSAEKQLARALPEMARTAYCLIKLCFKSAKEQIESDCLKTFHLKTALFWVTENTDPRAWDENGCLWGARLIASFLIDSLGKKNLPSFFVPTNNLFRHLSDIDIACAVSLFQLIHDNPANFIQLVIDKELEFLRITMCEKSFKKIQEPEYINQFSWIDQLKFYCYALGLADNYPLYETMDNAPQEKAKSVYEHFSSGVLYKHQSGSFPFVLGITDDQLKYVDIFVQTVSQMEIDLFNVLQLEAEEDIIQSSEISWISEESLAMYPKYDAQADAKFGEHFQATVRLRLKFYANVFQVICVQLMDSRFRQPRAIMNQDALYIINFLRQLQTRRSFTEENIDDLLHYMLYFCHYIRLRHHNLKIDEQILRSMREFLQDAKHMMTIYFNPREIFPLPVDMGDKIDTILGECFPRNHQVNECKVT